MSINTKLAWRYLSARMTRTILTTCSVVLGVMLLVSLAAMMPPIAAIVQKDIEASKVEIDIMVSRERNAFFPAELVDRIARIPGAEATVGTIERPLRLPRTMKFTMPDGRDSSMLTLEIKAGDPARGGDEWRDLVRSMGHNLAAGREIDAADSGKPVAMISQLLAGAMQLGVGDFLALPSARGTRKLEIVGLLAGQRATVGKEQVYTTLSAAQEIFNVPGQIDHILGRVPSGHDVPAVQEQVKALLPAGYQFGSVSIAGGAWDTALQMAEMIFTGIGVLALIMAGLVMFNTFRIAVIQRRHDIGMLRAIGATRRSVIRTVFVEALIQGVLGTVAGIAAAYLLVWSVHPLVAGVIEQFFPGDALGQPEFPLPSLLVAGVLGVGIPVLSGVWPARAAGRLTPMEALRPSSQAEDSRHSGRRMVVAGVLASCGLVGTILGWSLVGVLLLFTGLLLVIPALIRPMASASSRLLMLVFAGEGHIAERNLGRQPGRAAITASTLAVGMAVLVTMSSFITSSLNGLLGYLDETLSSDYMLFPESFLMGGDDIGASPEFALAIAEIDGIERVATIRRGEVTAKDLGVVRVMTIDPVAYPEVSDLYFVKGNRDVAFQKLGERRTVIVNGFVAAQGNLKPGDSLTLNAIHGPQDYEVVAEAMDFLNAENLAVYVSHANGVADFNIRNDNLILMNVESDAETVALEDRILTRARDHPDFDLTSNESLKLTQEENFKGVEAMYSILMLIVVIPALLALANTLTANVLERAREIGVLRAIGSSRKQVRRMILAEGLLLAAFGTGLGLLAGLAFGWCAVGAVAFVGLPFPYHFPFNGIWLALGSGLVFGALASMAPARRAARQNIIEALAYE